MDFPPVVLNDRAVNQLCERWRIADDKHPLGLIVWEYIKRRHGSLALVYGEDNTEENHRVATMTSMDETTGLCNVRFRLFQDCSYRFSGPIVTVHSCFLTPVNYYELGHGRRFVYYGMPPRIAGSYGQCWAMVMIDMDEPTVHYPDKLSNQWEAGDSYSFNVYTTKTTTKRVIVFILGFLRSHVGDNSDWKACTVLFSEGENFAEIIKNKEQLTTRLSSTYVPDFVKFMSNSAGLQQNNPDYRVSKKLASCPAMAIFESMLAKDFAWRPKTIGVVMKTFMIIVQPRYVPITEEERADIIRYSESKTRRQATAQQQLRRTLTDKSPVTIDSDDSDDSLDEKKTTLQVSSKNSKATTKPKTRAAPKTLKITTAKATKAAKDQAKKVVVMTSSAPPPVSIPPVTKPKPVTATSSVRFF